MLLLLKAGPDLYLAIGLSSSIRRSIKKLPGFALGSFYFYIVSASGLRLNQFRHSLFSQTTRIGDALKIDEYVPLNTPIKRMTTK